MRLMAALWAGDGNTSSFGILMSVETGAAGVKRRAARVQGLVVAGAAGCNGTGLVARSLALHRALADAPIRFGSSSSVSDSGWAQLVSGTLGAELRT